MACFGKVGHIYAWIILKRLPLAGIISRIRSTLVFKTKILNIKRE